MAKPENALAETSQDLCSQNPGMVGDHPVQLPAKAGSSGADGFGSLQRWRLQVLPGQLQGQFFLRVRWELVVVQFMAITDSSSPLRSQTPNPLDQTPLPSESLMVPEHGIKCKS